MSRTIFAASIVALVAVVMLTGARQFTRVSASSNVAAATKTPVATTPTATPMQTLSVAEQNLDADGNIRVHEQGAVNVNVVSASPKATIIPVFSGASVPPSGSIVSYVDVSACSHLDVFDEGSSPNNVEVWTSIDGANRFAQISFTTTNTGLSVVATGWGYRTSGTLNFGDTGTVNGDHGARSPFVGVELSNGVNPATGANVWLYCVS